LGRVPDRSWNCLPTVRSKQDLKRHLTGNLPKGVRTPQDRFNKSQLLQYHQQAFMRPAKRRGRLRRNQPNFYSHLVKVSRGISTKLGTVFKGQTVRIRKGFKEIVKDEAALTVVFPSKLAQLQPSSLGRGFPIQEARVLSRRVVAN